MRTILASLFVGMLLSGPAVAIDADGPMPTPELQERYDRLTAELRCLVCQNQTVADSNADLAKDLRGRTREMLLAGMPAIVNPGIESISSFLLFIVFSTVNK